MIGSTYWFEEAAKYEEYAADALDPSEKQEFLELAKICFDVAIEIEDRATAG